MNHRLPGLLPNHLLRLTYQYARQNPKLNELIAASRVLVIEEAAWDRWNGGMHGHDLHLYVPITVLGKIDVDEQLKFAEVLREDLKKLIQNFDDEFLNAVVFEMEADDDPNCQRAKPFSRRPVVNPGGLSIWKPGLVRVFVSHRDGHKAKAHRLAKALEPFGFSCFVAHDTIPANEEWRRVIVNGLETMEMILAFLTDDFHESPWTMQEIGYALGKGVPCVSLKLEGRDPPGFISHTQALRGALDKPHEAAEKLAISLADALGSRDRMQTALVEAFASSPNWSETKIRFDRMKKLITKLSKTEVSSIKKGFKNNDQLHRASYLTNEPQERLRTFLEETTDSVFVIVGRVIEDEIPF